MQENTVFDKLEMFDKYSDRTYEILKILEKFGLSKNESNIYLLLGKGGTKKASEIKNILRIPHSEVYRILHKLQIDGILQVSYEPSMVFSIVHPNKVFQIFIEEEKNKIKNLEENKKTFLKLWKDIPEFAYKDETDKSTFQTLSGHTQINSRIKEMIRTSKEEFLVLGSDEDFVKFYHDGIFDLIVKSKIKTKILGTKLDELRKFFKGIEQKNIRTISKEKQNNQCFAISDRYEVIFFTREVKNKKPIAIFTNSQSIRESLSLLFDFMWSNNNETKKMSLKNKQIMESEFRLRELKQELEIIENINQVLNSSVLDDSR